MTSLMQFEGETGSRGVRLEFILYDATIDQWNETREPVECTLCPRVHPQIYTAWRKPAGMFGPWVVFRYLGKRNVPDLSIPIDVPEIPRDAVALSRRENSEAWHRE